MITFPHSRTEILPPTRLCSQVTDCDGEDGVDAVLGTPVESVQQTSFIQERDIGDDQWEDLGKGDQISCPLGHSTVLRTDSVAPVAMPWRMRHAICV
jgi:hypothetical protein